MRHASVPILGFAAFSGTGKTTLLTQLIPLLKKAGLRLGVIKHSHHNFEIDKPGKDSFRLRAAGADTVMLVSPHRRAIISEFPDPIDPILDEQLAVLDQASLDLILVEGFRTERFPKIELHRPILNKPLIYPDDPSIIAIASDRKLNTPAHLSRLDLNNIAMIADFIIHQFLPNQ
ncbi:molybdopterin-guanine dinucleotide biosynthesis protein B [Methylomarinum sp. Ch1-1]|uniref:Molybdopterin-guanine dinucleotide biosynthesis protein B n=1 Tax=Methylomarinum roseum TaxID=3067653 RepID=A0AAU7NQ67_9GAMM|nr:molybdopterin-guanine dinucleotide biosynthesis protein B [Methylomarinum sp. Ch1-1]MDP4520970.1 molybdopterin-guanine dinucleotide biosynthesis protein B [Methylomarinum sp. Ch1-1]